MGDASQPKAAQVPTPQVTKIAEGIQLLLPLSRRGSGPGLIILTPADTAPEEDVIIKEGIPTPLIKWAEESYTVVQIQSRAWQTNHDALQLALKTLADCSTVDVKERYGLVAYDVDAFKHLEAQITSASELVGAIIYTDASTGPITTKITTIQHLAGQTESKLPKSEHLTIHSYSKAKSAGFALPTSADFDGPTEAISHTRNLTFLKSHHILAAPIFDLEAIWDEHTYYEFGDRSVENTMATMVQEPYVNHVPTITGGIGRENLTRFYTHSFIFSNPDDSELELISRTVGVDRVVDEFIFKMTHDREMDWLLPSIPPTGRKMEIPMMAVVNIRGDRLYHEHIHWDQGTALRQAGILPERLDWPAELGTPGKEYLDGSTGTQLRARLPVAGIDTATKLRDKNAVESNAMFSYKMTYASK